MNRGVLVAGATGTQGGAVVDELLATDQQFRVRALTRDPTTETARDLADRDVTVVEGDFRDQESLTTAMDGMDALFAMTDYWEAGLEGEHTQGDHLITAAVEAGIDHVVYSSAIGTGRADRPRLLDAKAEIEATLMRSGLPATILRPSYFMQNFELRREDVTAGTLALPLAPGSRLPMVDATDIGRAATHAFTSPEQYRGEAIPLISETRTLGELATVFSEILDRNVDPVHVPIHAARAQAGDDYADLFECYNDMELRGFVETLRDQYAFTPTGLESYLRRADWGRAELPGEWETARVQ